MLGQKIGRLLEYLVRERTESMRCSGVDEFLQDRHTSLRSIYHIKSVFITSLHKFTLKLHRHFLYKISHTQLEISVDNLIIIIKRQFLINSLFSHNLFI